MHGYSTTHAVALYHASWVDDFMHVIVSWSNMMVDDI